MSDDRIFEMYENLIDFLEEVLAPGTEIVLQDLREPMHIVDIRNSLDGRAAAGEVSEFGRLLMGDPMKYDGIKFVTNYKGRNMSEYRAMSTSTQIIRGESGDIIGMLCINQRLEPLLQMQEQLDRYIRHKSHINIGGGSFGGDVLVDVSKIVDDGMSTISGDPAALSPEQKKALVGSLSDRGIFLVRGAVSEVARRLDVSDQTVYRYMKESQA